MEKTNLIQAIFGGGRKVKLGLLSAIVALAAAILIVLYPERTDAILSIASGVYAVFAFVIAGVTVEDSLAKWAARPRYSADLAGLLKQLQDAAAALEAAKSGIDPDDPGGVG